MGLLATDLRARARVRGKARAPQQGFALLPAGARTRDTRRNAEAYAVVPGRGYPRAGHYPRWSLTMEPQAGLGNTDPAPDVPRFCPAAVT